MRVLRRISERHQITIPPGILKEAGAPEGCLFSIVADGGKIVLEPKEVSETIAREDWDKLDALVNKQLKTKQHADYDSPQAAKKHLKRPAK